MASLRKKPNSPYFIACYSDADGIQRQASTKKTDRREAQEIADLYEKPYRERQTEVQIRRTLSDACDRVNGAPLCTVTLTDWFDRWLTLISAEVNPRSLTIYSNSIKRVRKFAPEMCGKVLDRVLATDIYAMRAVLHRGRASSTTNLTLKHLSMIMGRAKAENLITDNPVEDVPRVKPTDLERIKIPRQPFTREQLKLMLKAADPEWRGMILAGIYSAGQRLSDCARLTPAQIDFAAGEVTFITRKTGETVIVPLMDEWRADLEARVKGRSPHEPLFPTLRAKLDADGGQSAHLSMDFARLLFKVGIRATDPTKKRDGAIEGRKDRCPYTFHSFRDTASSALVNSGVSDRVTRDLVGHASEAVSRRYTHIERATKRLAMNQALGSLRLVRKPRATAPSTGADRPAA